MRVARMGRLFKHLQGVGQKGLHCFLRRFSFQSFGDGIVDPQFALRQREKHKVKRVPGPGAPFEVEQRGIKGRVEGVLAVSLSRPRRCPAATTGSRTRRSDRRRYSIL